MIARASDDRVCRQLRERPTEAYVPPVVRPARPRRYAATWSEARGTLVNHSSQSLPSLAAVARSVACRARGRGSSLTPLPSSVTGAGEIIGHPDASEASVGSLSPSGSSTALARERSFGRRSLRSGFLRMTRKSLYGVRTGHSVRRHAPNSRGRTHREQTRSPGLDLVRPSRPRGPGQRTRWASRRPADRCSDVPARTPCFHQRARQPNCSASRNVPTYGAGSG